ncbi:MAG: hypothetical protein JXR68_04210 [Bacteroidales bacterium]|nr:hypothetical protein [Bacteroidales bacterium]
MKRFLFLSVLLIFTLSANAQACLNYTESAVRNNFPYQVFTSGTTTDGVRYISTSFDHADVGYYFNNEGYSYFVQMIPKNNSALNTMIKYYNANYVIISATEWRAYTDVGIMKVQLFFNNNGTQSIYFTNL